MNLKTVITITIKELRCFFSSARIIMNTLLPAAAMVPFMLLLGKWALDAQTTSSENFVVAAADSLSEDWLASASISSSMRISPKEAEAMLRDGRIDAFVEYSPSDNGKAAIRFASSIPSSASASALFNSWNSQGIVELIDVSGVSTSDSMAYSFLPAGLLVVVSMSAGTFAAFVSVREREAETLESLLSTGVTRLNITIGKYAAVLFGSLLSSLIGVVSSCVSLWTLAPTISALSPAFVAALGLACIASSVFFSALFLAIGFYAKSQREAQGYIGMISTFTMAPSLFLTGSHIGSAMRWALIPVLNWSSIMRDALYRLFDIGALGLSLGVSVILAVVLLACTSRFVDIEQADRRTRTRSPFGLRTLVSPR